MQIKIKTNDFIKAPELRVIGPDGENLGIMKREDALAKARALEYDLIEISPTAVPPIAKIMDFGKYQYELAKKQKEAKSKAHTTETKNIQVKPGTGEHDLELKAKQASGWLKDGHRVKIDLFLRGRAKYMDKGFLKERIDRVLNLITEEFRVADGPKASPKGLSVVIEKGKRADTNT